MVADAVEFEPVSTTKFPGNREKNRDFRQIPLLNENFDADMQQIKGLLPNSLRNKTGNLFERTGKYSTGSGNYRPAIQLSGDKSARHVEGLNRATSASSPRANIAGVGPISAKSKTRHGVSACDVR
jgi:hypothetical protein